MTTELKDKCMKSLSDTCDKFMKDGIEMENRLCYGIDTCNYDLMKDFKLFVEDICCDNKDLTITNVKTDDIKPSVLLTHKNGFYVLLRVSVPYPNSYYVDIITGTNIETIYEDDGV